MIVRDYREWTRYHAMIEFPFDGDVGDETELRRALREEIQVDNLTRAREEKSRLFSGSVLVEAVENAVFEVDLERKVAAAVITFETEGFRCRTSS